MKKLIISILFILCLSFQASAWNPMVVVSGSGGEERDWSTIGGFWRCEGETLSATDDRYGLNNNGDNIATPVGGANIDSGIYKHGSNSCDFPTEGDYYNFATCSDSQVLGTEGRVGFWLYIEDWTDEKMLCMIEYSTAATNSASLLMIDSDDLRFQWRGNSTTATQLDTTALGLTTGVWYYVEYAFKQSTPYREIFVNGVSKGSSGAAMVAFAGVPAEFKPGESVGGGTTDFHIDNIIFSTDSTLDLYTGFSGDISYGD